jgi:hypothetical protein
MALTTGDQVHATELTGYRYVEGWHMAVELTMP